MTKDFNWYPNIQALKDMGFSIQGFAILKFDHNIPHIIGQIIRAPLLPYLTRHRFDRRPAVLQRRLDRQQSSLAEPLQQLPGTLEMSPGSGFRV